MALSVSKNYRDIADQIVNKFTVAFSQINVDEILFLEEDEKAPSKYADIRIVKSPYTFITNYKFIITFYEPKIVGMTQAQINLLVMHELLHINDDFDGLRKHDVQDFVAIVSKFGAAWDSDPSTPDILADDIEDNI